MCKLTYFSQKQSYLLPEVSLFHVSVAKINLEFSKATEIVDFMLELQFLLPNFKENPSSSHLFETVPK